MVPDKIYLERVLCSDEVYDSWKKEQTISDDIEYIRKDTLMEKLNLALKLRTGDKPDINTDGVQTIKAMINYIESL